MSETAVCIFGYRRPEKLKRLLEQILRSSNSGTFKYFVFIDGPGEASHRTTIKSSVKVAQKFIEQTNGSVLESPVNKGLATSIISGVSEVLELFDNVIVLEDDLIIHPDFFNYMCIAIDMMRYDKSILNVSGFQYPRGSIEYPNLNDSGMIKLMRPHTWGWAISKTNWAKLVWDMKQISKWAETPALARKFAFMGPDLPNMLAEQTHGRLDSWGVRMAANQCKLDQFTLYPNRSLVQNDGFDDVAVHTRLDSSSRYNDTLDFDISLIKPIKIKPFSKANQLAMNSFFTGDTNKKREDIVTKLLKRFRVYS